MGKVYEHHIGKANSAIQLPTYSYTKKKKLLTALVNCDARWSAVNIVFCAAAGQSSCNLNSGDWFQNVWYGAPEGGWPSLDSSWQCYYMLGTTTKISGAGRSQTTPGHCTCFFVLFFFGRGGGEGAVWGHASLVNFCILEVATRIVLETIF